MALLRTSQRLLCQLNKPAPLVKISKLSSTAMVKTSFAASPSITSSKFSTSSASYFFAPPVPASGENTSASTRGQHTTVPKALWRLGRLNHVAIAVPDLDAATAFYRDVLGATVSRPCPLPEHGVTTVFIELDNTKLELLHPLGESSPIANFFKKNKNGGLHHVCLEVDDLSAAMASVREGGVRCLSEAKIGAHGKPVVFLHPQDCNGVLVELEQV